jgi:hypothetical protein
MSGQRWNSRPAGGLDRAPRELRRFQRSERARASFAVQEGSVRLCRTRSVLERIDMNG